MSADFVCHQFPRNLAALAAATSFLTTLPEFAEADDLMAAVSGQVIRKHYVFVSQADAIVGYAGWALCAPGIATAYAAGTHEPTHEECLDGEVVLVMILGARSAAATRQLTGHIRERYQGRRYVARRIRGFGLQPRGGLL